jgi:hypothetical protein
VGLLAVEFQELGAAAPPEAILAERAPYRIMLSSEAVEALR